MEIRAAVNCLLSLCLFVCTTYYWKICKWICSIITEKNTLQTYMTKSIDVVSFNYFFFVWTDLFLFFALLYLLNTKREKFWSLGNEKRNSLDVFELKYFLIELIRELCYEWSNMWSMFFIPIEIAPPFLLHTNRLWHMYTFSNEYVYSYL